MSVGPITPEVTGNFHTDPAPKLLFALYRKRFTGRMVVGAPYGRILYLRYGVPVTVEVDDAPDLQDHPNRHSTGRVLLETGQINEMLYKQVAKETLETGEGQGELLKASGMVDEEQIHDAHRRRLLLQMLELFTFEQAEF